MFRVIWTYRSDHDMSHSAVCEIANAAYELYEILDQSALVNDVHVYSIEHNLQIDMSSLEDMARYS